MYNVYILVMYILHTRDVYISEKYVLYIKYFL